MSELDGLPFKEMHTGRFRDAICRHCLRSFKQYELSPAVAAWVKSLRPSVQKLWAETIKDNALPLYCMKCERHDLATADSRKPAPPIAEDWAA